MIVQRGFLNWTGHCRAAWIELTLFRRIVSLASLVIPANVEKDTIDVDDIVIAAGSLNGASLTPHESYSVQSPDYIRVGHTAHFAAENVEGGVNVNDGLCVDITVK